MSSNITLSFEMESDRHIWIIALLKAERLKAVWDNDDLAAEVQFWKGDPVKTWFRDEALSKLKLAKAHYSERGISFTNGRHRTRWLLQQGYEHIPVMLLPGSFVEAMLDGILVRPAMFGDLLTHNTASS